GSHGEGRASARRQRGRMRSLAVSPPRERDSETAAERWTETVAKPADLKSLARLVLARDTGRDSGRDARSRNRLMADADMRQRIGHVRVSRFPRGETPRQPAPPAYARTFTALERQCPVHVAPDDWRQAIEDGYRFLARWGEQAAALGWTTQDLFGL